MPLMTPLHHSQFHGSIGMKVGQIFGWTFSNVSKIHDPSPLWLKKCNRRKYDTQTKMVSYDSGHTGWNLYDSRLWPAWPLPTIDLWWTFWPIWPGTAACDKIARTVSPNHLGQILLPLASMPLMTPFHHSQFHGSIGMEVGQIFGWTFSNVPKIHDPSPIWLQKCNRRKCDTHNKNGLIWLRTYWVKLSCDPRLWPVWPLPTIDLWQTFWPTWPVTAACDKIALIVSPNHLGQI